MLMNKAWELPSQLGVFLPIVHYRAADSVPANKILDVSQHEKSRDGQSGVKFSVRSEYD